MGMNLKQSQLLNEIDRIIALAEAQLSRTSGPTPSQLVLLRLQRKELATRLGR